VAKQSKKTMLFLDATNQSHSRFAEVLFNSVAGRLGLPWRASSRGLAMAQGVKNVGPMASAAVAALESLRVRDAEAVTRPPAPLTTEDLERATSIIALKQSEHLSLLQERFSAWVERVEFWDIDDSP
jgi:protein-tyrosine-phosphatase